MFGTLSKCFLLNFSLCSPFSYCASNIAIARVVTLTSFLHFLYRVCRLASFLYCSPYSYLFFNYCDSNRCCPFSILKVIAKRKEKLIAVAFKSKKDQEKRYKTFKIPKKVCSKLSQRAFYTQLLLSLSNNHYY